MDNQYNELTPFRRDIAATQAKYQMVKKNDAKTGQGSYNLSLDLQRYLISKSAIIKDGTLGDERNEYYVLADGVKLKLKHGIIDIIGSAYDNESNKILFVHSSANDGTTKFQIKRTDHKDGENYVWFTRLYDKNCEGAQFSIYYDELNKVIYIDNDLKLNQVIEELENTTTDVVDDENIVNIDDSYNMEDFLSQVFMSKEEYDILFNLLKHKKNLILQGSPGVGKTFMAKRLAYSIMGKIDNDKILSVQFHQSYSYEDFIEGIRPNENGEFVYTAGIFKQFVEKAKNDLVNKYFCIIDEINRGNLSKILGELMKLIECDKRNTENAILPYSKESFTVPDNLYIIGTMNTADRSLAMVDYALRRRFAFYHVKPAFDKPQFRDYLLNKNKLGNQQIDKICLNLNKLNEKINNDLGQGFEIGHSYFVNTLNSTDFDNLYKEVVEYEIKPLLEEYLLDDNNKIEEYKGIL